MLATSGIDLPVIQMENAFDSDTCTDSYMFPRERSSVSDYPAALRRERWDDEVGTLPSGNAAYGGGPESDHISYAANFLCVSAFFLLVASVCLTALAWVGHGAIASYVFSVVFFLVWVAWLVRCLFVATAR